MAWVTKDDFNVVNKILMTYVVLIPPFTTQRVILSEAQAESKDLMYEILLPTCRDQSEQIFSEFDHLRTDKSPDTCLKFFF